MGHTPGKATHLLQTYTLSGATHLTGPHIWLATHMDRPHTWLPHTWPRVSKVRCRVALAPMAPPFSPWPSNTCIVVQWHHTHDSGHTPARSHTPGYATPHIALLHTRTTNIHTYTPTHIHTPTQHTAAPYSSGATQVVVPHTWIIRA